MNEHAGRYKEIPTKRNDAIMKELQQLHDRKAMITKMKEDLR